MNWIDLVSAILGLSCVFLAGRGKTANFWIGYIYNIFLLVLFASRGLYAVGGIQLVAFAINAIGHYRWTHPGSDETAKDGSLAVTRLSAAQAVLYYAALAGVAAALYLILRHTDDPQALLDAICTALILLAQWLSAQKKLECWIVWMVVNIMNLILYIKAGLIFMPIVSALYLANGIWSYISWRKNEKGNTQNN